MLGTILKVLYNAVSWIFDRIFFWRERRLSIEANQDYIDQLESMDCEYHPERPDVEVALKCKEYIDQLFPNGVEERIRNMSQTELLEFFRQMESDAEQLMGVQIDEVDFYTDNDNLCGYYRSYDNSIHLNAVLILSGRIDLIQEQVYTIFHELKHARQWAAIRGKEAGTIDYGYSEDQLRIWIENYMHYIPSYVSDELYRKQPVELDAFGFEAILKGERRFEVI